MGYGPFKNFYSNSEFIKKQKDREMSNGVNKVIIIGRLGKDVDLRFSESGTAVAKMCIATNESWNDKLTGKKKELTEWHNIVLYKKLAELAGEYLKKGSNVYIEGKLKTSKWVDKDGNNRYTTEIVAKDMQFLSTNGIPTNETKSPLAMSTPNNYDESFDDDIPF